MALPQVIKNAGMASIQVLVSGVVLFILYFYLLRAIGAAQLGIWSIVLATGTAVRLSELGLAAGVVRFVAKYLAQDDPARAAAVVQTAFVSIACLMAIAVVPLYLLLGFVLDFFLAAEETPLALALLPFALVALWIGSLGSVLTSGLDGVLRTDYRSWILMLGVVSHLLFVFLLVPEFGLLGLGYAQVLQSLIVLSVSWLVLRRRLRELPAIPWRWDPALLREMLGYGLNIQIASIAQLLLDPMTKMLLSKFAGIESVAYFEMSNRMVMQIRSLVVSANQVMVPIFSRLNEATPQRLLAAYRESYVVLLFVALPLFSGLVAILPVVSELWIGQYQPEFVLYALILATGWFLNTLNAPSYFANMGTGHVRWNTLAHVAIGLLNASLGVLLGTRFGGSGVVFGFSIALVIGSALVIVNYHRRYTVEIGALFPRDQLWLFLGSVIVPAAAWAFYLERRETLGLLPVAALSVGSIAVIFAVLAWFNPVRRSLLRLAVSGPRS